MRNKRTLRRIFKRLPLITSCCALYFDIGCVERLLVVFFKGYFGNNLLAAAKILHKMRKQPRASLLLDTMHKGFVCACVGVTLYGTYMLGWRFYRYFTVIKPQSEERELLAKRSLLAEGSSDTLQDTAPPIKA